MIFSMADRGQQTKNYIAQCKCKQNKDLIWNLVMKILTKDVSCY